MTTMRRYAVSHLGLHKILGTTVTMIMMISSSENAIIVEDDHIFLSYTPNPIDSDCQCARSNKRMDRVICVLRN